MRAIFLAAQKEEICFRVYSPETVASLGRKTELDGHCYDKKEILENPAAFQSVEAIFSTWGMPSFTEAEIRACFPSLKIIFYGAGTVQSFARPFLDCGVRVVSAWGANGVPVAEYTVAQIILANKGFFTSARLCKMGRRQEAGQICGCYPGNFETAVGVIGAGMIGKMVIRRLKDYRLSEKVFDPFLPQEQAEALGVQKCSLEELFSTCQVVTNHLANNAQTRGMLTGSLFASMVPYATFLNTGRGAQVVEPELVQVLRERPDLTAVLDVTDPEPPEEGHPFYSLPNCVLTSHIAGSQGREVHRMGEYMEEELDRLLAGEPLRYEVTAAMLATMA